MPGWVIHCLKIGAACSFGDQILAWSGISVSVRAHRISLRLLLRLCLLPDAALLLQEQLAGRCRLTGRGVMSLHLRLTDQSIDMRIDSLITEYTHDWMLSRHLAHHVTYWAYTLISLAFLVLMARNSGFSPRLKLKLWAMHKRITALTILVSLLRAKSRRILLHTLVE